MSRIIELGIVVGGLLTLAVYLDPASIDPPKAQRHDRDSRVSERVERGPIPPLSPPVGLDPERVALGERLFHEPGLSRDGKISCASCHDIASGGDDGRRRSIGVGGAEGEINAPTVLNAALGFRQFWDGRVETLEEQVDGPIGHKSEMGSDWPSVVAWLQSQDSYRKSFENSYDDGVTPDNVRNAIANYERSLITVDSPFDRFLRGERSLSSSAMRGYQRFIELGCISCHQGRAIGGNLFQRFGLFGDYFEDRGDVTEADLGRFAVTQKEIDRYVFKVPSLRNIARTAPYLHDGSLESLSEVVRTMAHYQLGVRLPDRDVDDLVAFLESLTGELPRERLPHK